MKDKSLKKVTANLYERSNKKSKRYMEVINPVKKSKNKIKAIKSNKKSNKKSKSHKK